MNGWLQPLALIVVSTTAACEQSHPGAPQSCVSRASAAIFGAEGGGSPPGQLNPERELAIGALQSSPEAVICSGTLIAPRWVLSAAHCMHVERLSFRTGTNGEATVAVVRAFPHPDRDLALLELEFTRALSDWDVQPIPLYAGSLGADWVGREVTLAGLGETESGLRGMLRFVVEPVVAVSEEQLVVDGRGVSGACHGDSGGPLLANTPGELIGVLSGGSNDCVGVDRYQRIDTVIGWIHDTIAQAARDPCGALGWEGTCTTGDAMWCSYGQIVIEDCQGEQICGYDLQAGGFRCLDAELDPCGGVGRTPECMDDLLVRCSAGELVRKDCAECGQRCRLQADGAVCE